MADTKSHAANLQQITDTISMNAPSMRLTSSEGFGDFAREI